MRNRLIILLLLVALSFNMTACTLFRDTLDNKSGFSNSLEQTETFIRNAEWESAKLELEDSVKVWKKIRPWLQIDIDHDYVKDIEDNFTRLEAYLETEEQPDSLATILLIIDVWENISIY